MCARERASVCTWIMDDRKGIQNEIEKRQVGDRTQWYPRHKRSKIERKEKKTACDKDYIKRWGEDGVIPQAS